MLNFRIRISLNWYQGNTKNIRKKQRYTGRKKYIIQRVINSRGIPRRRIKFLKPITFKKSVGASHFSAGTFQMRASMGFSWKSLPKLMLKCKIRKKSLSFEK